LILEWAAGLSGSLNHDSEAITPNQRLFNRGFATTSYASQGKTVDTVLLSESRHSGSDLTQPN